MRVLGIIALGAVWVASAVVWQLSGSFWVGLAVVLPLTWLYFRYLQRWMDRREEARRQQDLSAPDSRLTRL